MSSEKKYILDDRDLSRTRYSEICTICKHFNRKKIGKREAHTCKAFPEGIPEEIWEGENNHRKPYPGDHGIQFEKK